MALSPDEKLIEQMLEASPDGGVLLDEQGRICMFNSACEALLGYRRKEVVGESVDILVPARFAMHAKLRGDYRHEPTFRRMGSGRLLYAQHKNGEEVPVEIGIMPMLLQGERWVVCTLRDMTDSQRKQEALLTLTRAIDVADEAISITNPRLPGNPLIYANAKFVHLTGHHLDEIVGRECGFLYGEATDPETWDSMHAAMRSQQAFHGILQFHRKNNEAFWSDVTLSPVFSNNNELLNFVIIQSDVSERMRADKQIRELAGKLEERVTLRTRQLDSERLFLEHTLDSLDSSICVLDATGNIVFVNSAWRYFGEENGLAMPGSGLGVNYLSVMEGAENRELQTVAEEFRQLLDGTRNNLFFEYPCHSPEKERWFSMRASRFVDAGEVRIVVSHTDETEQMIAMRLLADARDSAEAANRAKSQFLTNMSHEIRTPMNAILGYTQLLTSKAEIPEALRGHLDTINRSGEHLMGLIDDILVMSKIEAGQMGNTPELCNLHQLLYDMQDMFSMRAKEKRLQLSVTIADNVPELVRIDAGKLRQITINLIGNAIKFTSCGAINIRLLKDGSGMDASLLVLEVEDDGIGISMEYQERIFNAFEQVGNIPGTVGGTGLGLSISREYAHIMGGKLLVRSRPGEGALLRLEIPYDAVSSEGGMAVRIASAGIASTMRLSGKKVHRMLVVDDVADNRTLLAHLLSAADCEVIQAENGIEALKYFDDTVDMIFMDVNMPLMDGEEAITCIRSLPGGHDVPIIVVTANAFEEQHRRLIHKGANGVLSKPFKMTDLYDMVEQHLVHKDKRVNPATVEENTLHPTGSKGESMRIHGSGSDDLFARMRHAVRIGDIDQLEADINIIAETQPDVAVELRQWAHQFDYDSLLRWLC